VYKYSIKNIIDNKLEAKNEGVNKMDEQVKHLDDSQVESFWGEFKKVPFDHENQIILEDFHNWKNGTKMGVIVEWFDQNYSKGSDYLFREFD